MSSGAPLWLTQAQCERGTNWIGGAYRILMTQYSFSNAAMKGGALRSRLLLSCAGKFGPEVACGMHAEWGYQPMVPAVCMYTELRMYKTYLSHGTTPLSEHLCLILLKFALTCHLFLSLPYSYDVWAACKREYPKECK